MRIAIRLTTLMVLAALMLSLFSCADFGVGQSEDDFKKYFSGVYLLSKQGIEKYPIDHFNRDISMEDMDIPVVVTHGEYCYIGFRVAEDYTVSLSEFAFFAKSESGEGVLELEFYIIDKMPTSIKDDTGADVEIPSPDEELDTDSATPPHNEQEGEGGTTPSDTDQDGVGGTEPPADGEDDGISEEVVFISLNKFHTTEFKINEEWNSVLLEFDGSKTVEPKKYVVVRVNNNCYVSSDDEEEVTPSVSFTFNYLLFHFTDAHKE